jgi:uncharacterized protein YggE
MLKLIVLAATLAGAAVAPAWAQDERVAFQATTLRLSATGETRAAPDIASINVGVETEAPSAAEALQRNRGQMTAAIAALKAQGVLAKDIQTSGLDLNPQYVFHDNARTLTGYQASNAVTIIVRDLTRLGATVDAVVAAGANQVNGVTFSLADPERAEDAARRAAMTALQAKAALYAEAAGYRIDRLVSLSDADAGVRPLRLQAPAMARMAATPAEPGQLEVTAVVNAVYELKR